MPKNNVDNMSFLQHLEILRWHLVRSIIAVLAIALLAFFFRNFVFDVIIFGPKNPEFITYQFLCNLSKILSLDDAFCITELPFRIQSRTMSGQFSAHLWTSIWAGVILGFPYIIYEAWKFISPGLYKNERKNAQGFILISSFLFFMGVAFGYYVVCPLSINFLGTYRVSDLVFNDFDLSSYISTVRSSVLASGVIFELPIIIYFLTKIGIITPKFLKKYRRHAFVLVLMLSAIITPPDIASQVIVSIPLVILYEIGIIVSSVITKRQKIKTSKTTT